ncbi:DUF2255 family protein [Gramella sp. AN32]|uniref:DUF2255 family protein n=1 Tax=Christiangramia antarctica TaxID=2058158 RepID=A0ABW5X7A5_9FLAO|nr:DUF2255 family protein [Gramella sp. AN32]MCM4156219.1 DUF2255 domain-containing protein [Gramella sp. AN32]
MFPQDIYSYLKNNTLTEIKGGSSRKVFLPIWIVEVEHRLFARSWGQSEHSWYTEMLKFGIGQIKIGDIVFDVRGEKLGKNDPMQLRINQAYLSKYTQKENTMYAEGITKPEYADFTMEFHYESRASGK